MGCGAGVIFYFFKGNRVIKQHSGMSYASKKEKFIGGISLLKNRAPVLGGRNIVNLSGSFAMWGGLFSLTDCTLVHLRNKEDYFNNVVGGFVTGGLLAVRCK